MKKHLMAILLGLGLANVSAQAQAAYPSGSNSGQKIGSFSCRQWTGRDEWLLAYSALVLETAKDTSKPGFQKVLVLPAPWTKQYEGDFEAPGCTSDEWIPFNWWPNMAKYGHAGWLDETWSDRPRPVLGNNGKPLQIANTMRSLPLLYVGGCKGASCKFVFYEYSAEATLTEHFYKGTRAVQINYTR